MEITEDYEVAHSQRLREFNVVAKTLLSRDERQILYTVLKDYKRRRDVRRLVQGLRLVFQSNRKVELIKYVRYFLSDSHIPEFDRLTNFHSMFRPRRRRHRKKPRLHEDRLSVSNSSTGTSSRTHRDVRVFTLQREPEEPSLGFSVRGGSEHGLALYISEIDEGSVAEKCGLEVGDKLLEVNNISVKGAASSSAVKVLTGSNHLKLVVQRTHKIPEWRLSKEKTSWFDVHDKKLISGDFEECGMTHFIRGLDVDVPERRVNLKFGKNDKTLGFNVRGGKEYGLGIYISKVDKTGLAEKNGVRVGDQIIDVNGVPFDNITHVHAVEVLKDKKHLILTLRDVGRFPAYKELYAEYTWSNGPIRAATSMTGLTDIHIKSEFQLSARTKSSVDLFTNKPSTTLQSEIFLPADRTDQLKIENDIKSDDNESLLDFEALANDMYGSGTDNPGYESDTNVQPLVVVHAETMEGNKKEVHSNIRNESVSNNPDSKNVIDHSVDIRVRDRTVSNSSDLKDYDHVDQIDNAHNKSNRDGATSPEQLYAKIDKRKITKQSRTVVDEPEEDYSDSSSNASGKEDQYNVTTQEHKKVFLIANQSSLHSQTESTHRKENDTNVHVGASTSKTDISTPEERSHHFRRHTVHDIENDSENHLNVIHQDQSQKKIHGALYSQIRRLSAGSLSASSLANSQENLAKTRSQENIHNDVTLLIRKTDQVEIEKENVDVYQQSQDDIENPYDMFADNNSEIITDGEDETFVTTDMNFSMQKIDETITDLENRKMTLGEQELNMLDEYGYDGLKDGGYDSHKNTKWKTFKNIIKGSLRMKSLNNPSSSSKKRALFERNIGTHSLHRNSIDGYNMAIFEESATRMLDDEEFEAVLRHVKTYHDGNDIQTLIDKLLAILDKPEKLLLLKDIRGVIYPQDMNKFDNEVNRYEVEAYEKLSMKLHLPLNHDRSRKPRRHLVTTELGERGHFHLKPYGQQETEGSKTDIESHNPPRRSSSRGGTVVRTLSDRLEHSNTGTSGLLNSEETNGLKGAVIVHLSKNKNNLGLELSDKNRPDGSTDLLVAAIKPGSAADDDSVLQVGMILLSVDSHALSGCTVEEAEAVLQKCYLDKQHVSMKLALLMPAEWTTM